MLYFYSGILKDENEEYRFDGTVDLSGGIKTAEQFSKIQEELKKDILHEWNCRGIILENPFITFTSFNQL